MPSSERQIILLSISLASGILVMITATAGTKCLPMVRIAANEPWLAKAPMDLGALGINFPMICNRADAEKAVRSLRYPPRGDRLWGPFHAAVRGDDGRSFCVNKAAPNTKMQKASPHPICSFQNG